jgi:hypothetical protein
MKRFGVGAAAMTAMVISASLAMVAMSGAAYALSSVSCSTVSGTITTAFKISNCAPKNTLYVSASAPISSLATGKGTITWLPSKKTTIISTTHTTKSPGGCGTGGTEYDIKGTVTGGTATYTKKGDVISGRACVKGSNLSLVPGTKLTL